MIDIPFIQFELWAIAGFLCFGVIAFVYEASRFYDIYSYWVHKFFEEEEDDEV
jgi:hypothetical protein